MSMMRLVTAVALLGVASSILAAPQRRAAPRQSKPALARQFDPKTYAASIEGVDCSNVASRASSVTPIEPALRGIANAYPYGPPVKGEFESSAAFDQRVLGELSAKLGGTNRVVAVIPIRDMAGYDADTSTMTINPVASRIKENVITVKAYSGIDRHGHFVGSNAYGATAEVSRETFTQFYMLLPARSRMSMKVSMDPETARSFKDKGSLVLVGSLLSPYIAYERTRGRATIGDPTDTTYLKFYLGIVAQCAVVTSNGQEVGRFEL